MYKDIYDDSLWYLECFHVNASKESAVHFLRETMGFRKVIGFGDNLNDISLFNACDEKYAVGNAKEEVKSVATKVIGTNEQDGVVKWMENYLLTMGG